MRSHPAVALSFGGVLSVTWSERPSWKSGRFPAMFELLSLAATHSINHNNDCFQDSCYGLEISGPEGSGLPFTVSRFTETKDASVARASSDRESRGGNQVFLNDFFFGFGRNLQLLVSSLWAMRHEDSSASTIRIAPEATPSSSTSTTGILLR
jgi:hypothetical protein